jgi:hypothetical protein
MMSITDRFTKTSYDLLCFSVQLTYKKILLAEQNDKY